MPEFRDRYDNDAVSGRISQPPFAELAHRGRRRAHRTRTVRLAGVAVLVALTATPLLTLPGETGPSNSANPPPTPESAQSHGLSVEFLNVNYGAAVYTIQESPGTCGTGLVTVTRDRGSTWSEQRPLPSFPDEEKLTAFPYDATEGDVSGDDGPVCLSSSVIPIAPDTLVMPLTGRDQTAYTSNGLEPPTTSFISHDAGRTWQEYEPALRIADTVPDGIAPEVYCPKQVIPDEDHPTGFRIEECEEPRVGWYDPQTGDQMVLSNSPPLVEYEGGLTMATDGSIWAIGLDPSGDQYHVSVSRDWGRTWRDESPISLDNVDEPTSANIAATDGDTAYFSWTLDTIDPPPPVHLYHTTDGGETWQPVDAAQQFFEGLPMMWGFPMMWATRDGGLVVEDAAGGQYLSRDGGETFEKTDLEGVWDAYPVPGGFFAEVLSNAQDPVDGALSEDGLNWRTFQVPPPTP